MNMPYETNFSAPRIKSLNEKAVIVQLKTGRPRMSRRDKAAENLIRDQFGDESLTAHARIFKHASNPVYKFMTQLRAVYNYHTEHTYASNERGNRILAVRNMQTYQPAMRDLIEDVERDKQLLLTNYYHYVQMDIDVRTEHARAMGKPTTVSASEYPSVEEFDDRTFLRLRLLPLPDSSHFLFDVDQQDRDSLNDYISDVESAVRVSTVKRLLDPVSKLIEKISKPIDPNTRFHTTTLTNIIDAVEAFKEMNIDDDPQLQAMVSELDIEIKKYNVDWLKESPTKRTEAREALDQIASKISAFM